MRRAGVGHGVALRAAVAMLVVGLVGGLSVPFQIGSNVALAAGVVGTGTAVSCDEAALDGALAGGGPVTFDCGGAPHTISLTTEKVITFDTQIDGGGLITLDGQGSTRLVFVNSGVALDLTNIMLTGGNGSGQAPGPGFSGSGGGIFNNGGTVTLTGSTLSSSTASSGVFAKGGGINNNGGVVTLINSALNGNVTTDLGGGIFTFGGTVTLIGSTLSGNNAGNGGGIYSNNGGIVTLIGSTVSNNSAGFVGGINNNGTLTLIGSTLSGNSATVDVGGIANFFGTVMLSNSTLTGNTSADRGGAISNDGGPIFVIASTISGNSAGSGGGIYSGFNAPTTTVQQSIVANNTATTSGSNCFIVTGTIVSAGSNLSNDASCPFVAAGDIQNSATVNLGLLADNGGPTHTMLPAAGSAAIDAAGSCVTGIDQRGVVRPVGAACDIGAVEVGGSVPPIQLFAAYNVSGTINEGGSATIQAAGFGPSVTTYDYDFDCDNNGSFETQGSGSSNLGTASCSFADSGSLTVGVRVCDASNGSVCATGSAVVAVDNVAPTVNVPVVNPSPSNEGQGVVASATFSDPGTLDTHSCTVDYDDGDGPVAGTITQGAGSGTCTGPAHTYLDDDPTGTSSDDYTVTVVVTDDDNGSGSNSVVHTVNNVLPVIESVTTNSPVPQGQPAQITVVATDVGVNDILMYSFDCDNDGNIDIGPQTSNSADCALDPGDATTTIEVKVEDDDLGMATATVVVGQTLTLCVSYQTGSVSVEGATGCTTGTIALTVPGPTSTTFCINNSTGGLRWAWNGQCTGGERPHLTPTSGPLSYCQSLRTGELRVPRIPGQCILYELPGVIPGL